MVVSFMGSAFLSWWSLVFLVRPQRGADLIGRAWLRHVNLEADPLAFVARRDRDFHRARARSARGRARRSRVSPSPATCRAADVDPRGELRSKIFDGMATFALIHGGGGSAWDWHLVIPALQEHGHDAVAVDLPSDEESAGWDEYADAVVQAIGDRRGVVVVGHSLGGFTAPLVCVRVPVDLLVLVAAMIPSPGELFAHWWANAGYEESGEDDVFYHDVSLELAAEAQQRERDESSKALREPWPLEAWPDTPTRYLLCRDDRMFPAAWARQHARERLGIAADEIDGGHYITLSRPRELAERLDAFAAAIR
jgi:pimeloyl-ACP methyl ester carboxylesterase